MKTMIIEQVKTDAYKTVRQLALETFIESFATYNTKEDMDCYVAEKLTEPQFKTELLNPNSTFYFAKKDTDILGYLKVNKDKQPENYHLNNTLEIQRIYVRQQFQNQHIGVMLLNKAKEVALKNGASSMWLGVWEHNIKAITFYKKHGFSIFGERTFVLGTAHQNDFLMKLEV